MFRGKDRYRPSKALFLVVGLLLIARGIIHPPSLVGFCWFAGLSAVALSLGIGIAVRSWTKVGPAGITICRGIGRRGRTYPWQEIRWIDVWKNDNQGLEIRQARITLANGRRRTLPALRHTRTYPQPTFSADFRRVVEWWELSTDPAARFQLPETSRTRLAPFMPGVILALLITVGVAIYAYMRVNGG